MKNGSPIDMPFKPIKCDKIIAKSNPEQSQQHAVFFCFAFAAVVVENFGDEKKRRFWEVIVVLRARTQIILGYILFA